MSKPNSRTNQKMTNDKFWQFRNLAGEDQKAEDVYKRQARLSQGETATMRI